MSQHIEKTADLQKSGKGRILKIMKSSVFAIFIVVFVLTVANLCVSVSHANDPNCDCASCHTSTPHNGSGVVNSGCSDCHDSPPQTGTHLVHYGSSPLATLQYAGTGVNSTDAAYKFGCGNCHPLDENKHGNGVVDIELYNPSAPAGSIKSLNPASAAYTRGSTTTTYASKNGAALSYTNGTCNNVYCHSGYAVSSTPVGLPVVDEAGNITYPSYTVTYSRVYKTTPQWGTNSDGNSSTAAFTACTACHDFPLTTSYPSVEAGVGDSHQWIDDYGYGNLHAYNMGYDPISCRTCHYATVTAANSWTRDGMDVTTYSKVSLASRSLHVNGQKDVVFDTTDSVVYVAAYSGATTTYTYSLNTASYNPGTKTCSNVACHQKQTSVTWGSPYRWWNSTECTLCHSY